MSTWDSPYLLAKLKRDLLRPAADEIPDATYYLWLSEGQNKVIADIASRIPWVAYSAPDSLTTADNKVFTFTKASSGNDAQGYPITPIGKVKIFPSLSCVPDSPWREGYDYLQEGSQIRIPNNRTYSGGTLYWRGIVQPSDLNAGVNPTLLPEASRDLIVLAAMADFADQGAVRPDLSQLARQKYDEQFKRWCLVWRTQFSSGGALGAYTPYVHTDGSQSGYIASIVVSP